MTKMKAQYSEVYFAGYDITGDSRQYDITDDVEDIDVTTFMEEVVNELPDVAIGEVDLRVLLNPAANRAHAALSGVSGNLDETLMILLGQNTTPAIGDPVFCMQVDQFQYSVESEVRNAVRARAMFKAEVYKGDWGIVLADTTITNDQNFSSVDQGASSSNGGVGYLECLGVLASDTYVVKIQDSPNDSVWSDLITFTLDGSARGGERISVSGAVDQYVRAIATRTGVGQSFKLAVGFRRNP